MPIDAAKAREITDRYVYLRDNGHIHFMEKVDRCNDFFRGKQWDPRDLAALREAGRPALTINKILSTIANVAGEQIYNRTDIAFRPRNEGATQQVADALTKTFMQISDNNQLDWIRSDVFLDGVISSRGYMDVRLDYTDSALGEVRVTQLNPKNVLPDSDADEYDPDTWNDVIITKWMTVDDIELLYSKKDAAYLRGRTPSYLQYSFDTADVRRDRFGDNYLNDLYSLDDLDDDSLIRDMRVIERQYKKLDKVAHFVDVTTGDMRVIPSSWDDEAIYNHLLKFPNLSVIDKVIKRIRWTVVCGDVVLHDDWSPYKHFTVIPYFPYFRRGTTIGIVENLISPQELLNKASSQELHTINTSANSGWIFSQNNLVNMSTAELETRGATTGLVVEVKDIAGIQKITPNQTPTGLDRVAWKAEDHIKGISGVSDYQQGFAREDVSAKSVQANQRSGQANFAKVMDNLNRTNYLIARNVLDLIQEFYTEERVILITRGRMNQQMEEIIVNEETPEGEIVNDLTLGEYTVVVTSQPERDTFEDTQFDQVVEMRQQLGIEIPDEFVIRSSRLRDKEEIIEVITGQADPEEAARQQELAARGQEAEVAKLEAETRARNADTRLKEARAQREELDIMLQQQNSGMSEENRIKLLEVEQRLQIQREEMQLKIQLEREKMQLEMQLKREQAKLARAESIMTR